MTNFFLGSKLQQVRISSSLSKFGMDHTIYGMVIVLLLLILSLDADSCPCMTTLFIQVKHTLSKNQIYYKGSNCDVGTPFTFSFSQMNFFKNQRNFICESSGLQSL
jgi:hypothetical protein